MLKFTVCAMTDGVEYVELEKVDYLEFIERGVWVIGNRDT